MATKLQYDYCAAYLDMFDDEPTQAPAIAARYANHPVDRWRNAFAAIVQPAGRSRGQGADTVADAEDRDQQQGQLAATEPASSSRWKARRST